MKNIYYINDHHKNKQTFDYINEVLKKGHVSHFINDCNYIYVGHVLYIGGIFTGIILSLCIKTSIL